jgi:hypothetical protein
MTAFRTRKRRETAKRCMSEVKNIGSGITESFIPTVTSVISGSLEHRENSVKIDVYNNDRKEHIAISILFGLGLFLHIIAQALI